MRVVRVLRSSSRRFMIATKVFMIATNAIPEAASTAASTAAAAAATALHVASGSETQAAAAGEAFGVEVELPPLSPPLLLLLLVVLLVVVVVLLLLLLDVGVVRFAPGGDRDAGGPITTRGGSTGGMRATMRRCPCSPPLSLEPRCFFFRGCLPAPRGDALRFFAAERLRGKRLTSRDATSDHVASPFQFTRIFPLALCAATTPPYHTPRSFTRTDSPWRKMPVVFERS